MTRLLTRHGRLDILVNCAGITGRNQLIEEVALAELWRVLEVNLLGTFLSYRAAVPSMRRQNSGRIVNLASIAGKEGNPTQAAYSAPKGGVIALTKALGKELADTEVRANCVAPAVIATELNLQMSPEALAAALAKVPLGRPGTADEVAALVALAWLASGECSFSTAACFDLSGGRATY
jgi:2-dehydro-3-deoxy-L-rhamnonate dehydrogenase (NAD+)